MNSIVVENRLIGGLVYRRSKAHSKLLGEEVHFGWVYPQALNESGVAPQGTLYFLHGGSGDDRQAVDSGLLAAVDSELLALLVERRVQIILPYIGGSWLKSSDSLDGKPFDRYFLDEVLPVAERGTKTDCAARMIAGLSMGGQAALSMMFRALDRFSAVAAQAPTLITFDFSNANQASDFFARENVQDPYRQILLQGFASQFRDSEQFGRYDPLKLIQGMSPDQLNSKRIYFNVGSRDEFGLAEGCRELSRILVAKGVQHSFEETKEGRHDSTFFFQGFPKLIRFLLA